MSAITAGTTGAVGGFNAAGGASGAAGVMAGGVGGVAGADMSTAGTLGGMTASTGGTGAVAGAMSMAGTGDMGGTTGGMDMAGGGGGMDAGPLGPEDGDPAQPIVSIPDVPCGGPSGGFGLGSPNFQLGGRDMIVTYPCEKHAGAPVTFILNLHGTTPVAQHFYQHG